ncbi:Variant SH3 domain containing protein [Aphelenchoides avenae]|nr:Variant SH3 domain containing protein [Aphelenchus avenae]
MRRVLKAVAFLYPDLGYCQGMGVVVASLLIVCGEVNTFWIMCALIEDFLPPNFYSHSLLGLQADERVVRHLMRTHMPDLIDVIERSGADISLIVVNWLLTLLASVFPIRVLLRVWDVLFFSGGTTLFRAIISMLKLNEEKVVSKLEVENNSAAAFNAISRLPLSINEPEALLEVMISFEYSITEHLINELRKKFQGVIMAQNGMIFSQDDQRELPKQKIARRKLTRSKSVLQNIFHQSMDDGEEDDPKTKNIRQTEIIVDLKNAVNQICRYFAACVEKHEKTINMQADYRHKSYAEECKEFVKARREGRKRARALLEFQAQEGDELAFRKNDLITIISEKDEHCWVGELDGQRGWFPAKFVELIDERGKNYCILGDEAVDTRVSELVRGPLATTFRRVLFHEAVSTSLMEQHNIASNSRLTLCDTFKLDQDGKVLSPEELLYRAVKSIDHTHNLVSAQLDVKLRSLVAYALNEQCLHLWFEVLCNSGSRQDPIRERFYQTWSFIRCPAWQQIKCELRLFAQLPFNLNVDSEVALSKDKSKKSSVNGTSASKLKAAAASKPRVVQANGKEPLKEGVRDMLIKHHLFSWDL